MNAIGGEWILFIQAAPGRSSSSFLRKVTTMLIDIQHAIQVFANLVVASTMAMSLAIGVAGVFKHRFPIDCGACGSPPAFAFAPAKASHGMVVASIR